MTSTTKILRVQGDQRMWKKWYTKIIPNELQEKKIDFMIFFPWYAYILMKNPLQHKMLISLHCTGYGCACIRTLQSSYDK